MPGIDAHRARRGRFGVPARISMRPGGDTPLPARARLRYQDVRYRLFGRSETLKNFM
jgi:hypothetical protein